jgi:HNH endonuclease/Rv0078B-related antitoxin
MIHPKAARFRLDPTSYETLRQQVLRRDGWRCQSCGTMSNLEVHHKAFRSHAGEDSELNLITLCAKCHASAHGTWKSDDGIAVHRPVQPSWYGPAAAGGLNIRPSRRGNILAVPISDTSPSAQALQLQIQRGMPGEQRLLLALEMSLFARELAKERIRREYPEWSDAQVARELVRLAFLPAPVPARLR